MRTINETFTDEEYEQLKKAKDGKSWHDFFLTLIKSKRKPNMLDLDPLAEFNNLENGL